MNINIIGKDKSGNVYTLPTPFWLTYESDLDAPAHALTLTFIGNDIPDFSMIEVTGDFFFDGIVDVVSRKKDSSGEKTVINARSFAAILLDGEAAPGVNNTDDFDIILWDFRCGGKVKGFLYDSYTPISKMTLAKGTSLWRYLTLFCEQTMGYSPRISDDGYIIAKPYSFETVHNFDESDPVAVEKCVDYTSIITSVSIRNQNGVYSAVMINTKADLPYSRQRFYIPNVACTESTSKIGSRVIDKSMRNKNTVKLTFPYIYNAKVGDGAIFENEEKAVMSVKHKLDSSGVKSIVTLCERKYL